ncbi:helix-turn-helix domain-containing protein [Modicisalibacter xianhensis]|uniref:Helix-turn-helix domain-containing protein n=1 Tax=Modicisalibacter xianhensis TaxID=442341 RepID=A0A1I3C8P4_9GAMM|nr:helix-turn-helix domain-containing protein [Halomonas xianhensis]SFH70783.1 Helix-turn-helix domain-containing protein [Halomonas xianhensis]
MNMNLKGARERGLACLKVDDAMSLGKLVRQVRKSQGLTLEMLAGLCGLSIRFLSELENGRETCSFVRIMRVLDTLGIELHACPPEAMTE